MNHRCSLRVLLPLLLAVVALPAAAGVTHRTLHDAARDRDVPVKITTPDEAGPGLLPTIFFSHGLGGSVEAAGYLAEGLAERGYVVVNVQHPGSDRAVWEGVPRPRRMAVLKAAANGEQAMERPRDVSFALGVLLAADEVAIDPERVGVAGHSFGAMTVRLIAGQTLGAGVSFADRRFRAAVALSSQPVEDAASLVGMTTPILHLTGTLDDSPISPGVTPENRRDAFAKSVAADRFLVVFDGADHGVFGGGERFPGRRDAGHDAAVQAAVVGACGLFFDAYLAVPPGTLDPAALRAAVRPVDVVESGE